jgi:hypothetical protein
LSRFAVASTRPSCAPPEQLREQIAPLFVSSHFASLEILAVVVENSKGRVLSMDRYS